ncbi:MAG TPA: hypothetical protein VMZ26_02885 [Pyrinomonadaceae bacterium]|nr:hypothetical protein [Pyrinomonadaceae bacterium]
MVNAEELANAVRARIDSHFEWLLVRSNGGTFPLRRDEIAISGNAEKALLSVLDDSGTEVSRILSLSNDPESNGIALEVGGGPDGSVETIRLVPRTPAIELTRNVEFARLEHANEIAKALLEIFPSYKLTRLALNVDNGRLAQIFLRDPQGVDFAIVTDVTATMMHEAIMTSAMLWFEKLQSRKKPIAEVWIVGERKQARNLRKLIGMFADRFAGRFRIFESSRKSGSPKLQELKRAEFRTLWREKPKKIILPAATRATKTAEKILSLSPEKMDIIFSKQGETVRFLGLPFARVRTIAGHEKAWFGIDRNHRQLVENSWSELAELVDELDTYRSPATPNKRHEFYRTAPEAWLESILRRNIKRLDANLILSPIYNQFRASADKIDLLAIRRDGRLVIVELKTSPDRETVFQAADYWRKIEIQRRRGELDRIKAFGDMKILDKPALVYVAAPALSFHRDFGYFAKALRREVEMWRFELREDWRSEIKILIRRDYS